MAPGAPPETHRSRGFRLRNGSEGGGDQYFFANTSRDFLQKVIPVTLKAAGRSFLPFSSYKSLLSIAPPRVLGVILRRRLRLRNGSGNIRLRVEAKDRANFGAGAGNEAFAEL